MGKTMNNRIVILFLALLVAGCATQTIGPTPAGENTYVVERKEGAFPTGGKPLLAEALAEANKFCSASEKQMKLISSYESSGPFIMGNYPKATVTFSCVEKLSK